MTKVIIRQPGYLPYLGYFEKIQSCDVFVHYDDAQYSVNGWDNRNKVRCAIGTSWLTVPVKKPFKKRLYEVEIADNEDWRTRHENIINECYNKAPFFKKYWPSIEEILNKKWNKLIDLNYKLIEHFNSIFDLKTKILKASELNLTSTKSEKLLEICKKLNATTYVSGEEGKNYLDEAIFIDEGIKVLYEKFQHPTYRQIHGSFLPNMSVIDLIFNEGDYSKKVLENLKNLSD